MGGCYRVHSAAAVLLTVMATSAVIRCVGMTNPGNEEANSSSSSSSSPSSSSFSPSALPSSFFVSVDKLTTSKSNVRTKRATSGVSNNNNDNNTNDNNININKNQLNIMNTITNNSIATVATTTTTTATSTTTTTPSTTANINNNNKITPTTTVKTSNSNATTTPTTTTTTTIPTNTTTSDPSTTTTIPTSTTNDNNSTTTNTTSTTTIPTTTTPPPPPPPLQLTIVTLEAEFPRKTSNILSKIHPVMNLAIDHVNVLYKGIINFTLIAEAGSCTKEVAVPAARISCRHNISAFIGTACSPAVETLAYMANTWNIPIITPVANTENLAHKQTFPRLTRVNTYMQASVVNTIMYVLELYGWTNVALFSEKDYSSSHLYTLSLQENIRNHSPQTNLLTYSIRSTSGTGVFTKKLKQAAKQARIANLMTTALVKLIHCASKLGYTTNGEFVWLYVVDGQPKEGLTIDPSKYPQPSFTQETIDMAAQLNMPQHLKQALFFHIVMDNYQLPPQFETALINESTKYGIQYTIRNPPPYVYIGYWDAVSIYATVINETLSEGGDPLDGLAISKKMWNRTFQGLDLPIKIDSKGDRDSNVTITGWNEKVGQFQTFGMMQPKFGKLEYCHGMTSFPWLLNHGKPPRNEPVCGYMGLDCDKNDTTNQIVTSTSVLVVLLTIGIIIVIFLYRRSKRHGDKDLLWWLIQGAELVMTTQRPSGGLSSITSSKASLKLVSGTAPDISLSSAAYSSSEKFALFKGQLVRVHKMDIKQVKLTNELLHDFKQVRELSHTNLNRLYGATVNENCVCLVMENCPKGTLQDLLGSDHVTLDAQFKFSLTMDIIDGLCYIHDSPLKWHGRLTSEVCLVDNRFSVKLANYGMPSLHGQVSWDMTSQEYKNSCLWKSPEMLRTTSHPGSKETDIYSMGIIFSEIVSRDGPFGREVVYMTLDEILHKISSPMAGVPVFRPSVDVPLKMSYMQDLMEVCWKEEPKYRPSVNDVRAMMKKSASHFCAQGSLVDNLMNRMEQYANNLEILVEDKTEELREEKKRSEELLYQMLPRSVADRLKLGLQIQPEDYQSVTIYFSDIVGFTSISAKSTPIEVVTLLNDLYSLFDGIVGTYDVYKVETIGDAYMVVSGLPSRNGYMHASHIANMALDLLCGIKSFTIPHLPSEKAKLRIGMHSGPVCAGVVGLKMPRYCLFGDTVNTASRMESHGQELRIHVSNDCKVILDRCGGFETEARGLIEIKGKGQMPTYWLAGAVQRCQDQAPNSQHVNM